jgi:hypothetical protein
MDSVISEFNERANEVETYFSFLEDALKEKACLSFKEKTTQQIKLIDTELQKILKANSFILLYNLVESSFKSTLQHLGDEINNSETSYKDAIPAIRKIWLQYDKKYFNDLPKGTKKLDYVYSIIDDITNQIVTIPGKLDGIGISGNLDAQKIKEYAALYGINSQEIDNKSCEKLYTVKNKRNELAHGDSSFAQCGRDYNFQQLNDIKKETVSYMRFILGVFKKHIDKKYYFLVA